MGLLTEVTRRLRPRALSDTAGLPPALGASRDGAWWWVRASVAGMMIGIVPGVIGGSLLISEYSETVREFARLSVGIGVGQIFMITHPMMILLALSVTAIPVGLCGALFGVLGGLTGPDVVRRAIPNQGIRQSAMNVPVFALIGVLVVGVPYGLINLTLAAGLTGVVPSSGDWLVLGLLPSLWFGLLGALIPAAACIQHWTLRLILWRTGVAPWRWPRPNSGLAE